MDCMNEGFGNGVCWQYHTTRKATAAISLWTIYDNRPSSSHQNSLKARPDAKSTGTPFLDEAGSDRLTCLRIIGRVSSPAEHSGRDVQNSHATYLRGGGSEALKVAKDK